MSRQFRLSIYLILGLILGGFASMAIAEQWYADLRDCYNTSGNFIVSVDKWTGGGEAATIGALAAQGCAAIGQGVQSIGPYDTPYKATYICTNGADGIGRAYGYCDSQCPAGQTPDANKQCQSPPPPACADAGTVYSSGYYLMGNSPTSSFPGVTCNGSCLLGFSGDAPAGSAVVGGVTKYYAKGSWQFMGPSNTCTGAVTTPPQQAALPVDTCASGHQGGYLNGKWICVDPASGNVVPSTPAAPTQQSSTTKSSVTNPDGSVTTTTTTTNGDGSTTITITTVQPNGNTQSTTTNTPPPGSSEPDAYCAQNPTAPMCKKIETCGYPGGPPCKIDETGTPEDGSLSDQKTDFEQKATEHKNFFDSLANQGDHGMSWGWVFPMPTGACGPMTFGSGQYQVTLNPCDKLAMVRDVLGFFIYIATALALLSIATGYGREGK